MKNVLGNTRGCSLGNKGPVYRDRAIELNFIKDANCSSIHLRTQINKHRLRKKTTICTARNTGLSNLGKLILYTYVPTVKNLFTARSNDDVNILECVTHSFVVISMSARPQSERLEIFALALSVSLSLGILTHGMLFVNTETA